MLFILVVSPERFKYINPQHAPPVCVMEYCVDRLKRITDKCYHVDSHSDAMYWFPSGDDVHFCDCIDTILPLKNLQTEFWVKRISIVYYLLSTTGGLQLYGPLQLQ